MIKELKEELLNKEFNLLDLDNTVQEITGSTASLFDNGGSDWRFDNSYVYYIKENFEICIGWELKKDNKDTYNVIVKVTDIFAL